MPRGKYKRKGGGEKILSNSQMAERSFTPVMVHDKDSVIRGQADKIAQLQGEVKRLRLLLDVSIKGGVVLPK